MLCVQRLFISRFLTSFSYLPTLEHAEITLQMQAMAMELMGAMEMDVGMNKPVCNAFFALQSQREPPATGWD